MDDQHREQLTAIDMRLGKCARDLEAHLSDTDRHVEGVRKELQIMRENHLAHIQRATEQQADSAIATLKRVSEMEKIAAVTETNLSWLMKYHWIVATSSIGALVASVLGILMQ